MWYSWRVRLRLLPKAWLDLQTPYKVLAKYLQTRSEAVELGAETMQTCGETLENIVTGFVAPMRKSVRMHRDYEETVGKRKRIPVKPLVDESESSTKVVPVKPAKKRRLAPRVQAPKAGYETEGNPCL